MSKNKILLGIEICDPSVRNMYGMPATTRIGVEKCWRKGYSWTVRRLKKAVKKQIQNHEFVLVRNGGGHINPNDPALTKNQRNICNRFKQWQQGVPFFDSYM